MPHKKDETGNRYGKLVVVGEERTRSSRCIRWRCRCDCGNETIVLGTSLRFGLTKSCGCYIRECISKAKKKDETGNRYGKQVVLDEAPVRLKNHVCWHCKCDCGNEKIVRGDLLRQGVTKSCGCCQRKTVSRKMTKSKVGNRYGKLLVVGESPNRYYGYMCWRCKCDCGNEREVDGRSLRQGRVKSCGCLRRGRKKKI